MGIKEVTVCDYCKEEMPEAPKKRNVVLYEGFSDIIEQNGMAISTPVMVILGVSFDVCEKCRQKLRMGIRWNKFMPTIPKKDAEDDKEKEEENGNSV